MMGADPDQITHWVNEVSDAYVNRNFEKAKEKIEGAGGRWEVLSK